MTPRVRSEVCWCRGGAVRFHPSEGSANIWRRSAPFNSTCRPSPLAKRLTWLLVTRDTWAGFFKGLATAWQQGEVRATHFTAPRPSRDWRTRKDPFETVWPRVRAWLEAELDRVGNELFARLQAEHPGVFPDGQLRTFQRRIKAWREAAARQLIFASSAQDAAYAGSIAS